MKIGDVGKFVYDEDAAVEVIIVNLEFEEDLNGTVMTEPCGGVFMAADNEFLEIFKLPRDSSRFVLDGRNVFDLL